MTKPTPPEGTWHTTGIIYPNTTRRWRRPHRHTTPRPHTAATPANPNPASTEETQRARPVIPKAGERRPAALWTPGPLGLARHQDTTAVTGSAYPFLAEAGLGAEGVFIGQDTFCGGAFTYDPWVLYRKGIITAPNVILAGIVGAGKSALAKSLYVRSLPFGRKVYVACDPKGEHTPIAHAVGGIAIRLGHGLANRLNPLDEGHRPASIPDAQWATQVAARRRDLVGALTETVLDRALTPVEHTAIDIALTRTVTETTTPVLPGIVDRILDPGPDADPRLTEDGRHAGHALRRLVAGDLTGLFDGPSTIRFDPAAPMITLDLSAVASNNALLSVLMTCASAWMEAALTDPDAGPRWVVYDEAWRMMAHPALLRRMDTQWRLARHLGIANLLIFHKLTDLDTVGDQGSATRALADSLLANAETRVIYRQETDQLSATALALGLTTTERRLLPTLGIGQGLWRIKHHSYIITHQLHPDELSLYDTRTKMLT